MIGAYIAPQTLPLDQPLILPKKTFFTKQGASIRRSTVLIISFQLVFPEAVFLVICDPSMKEL